MASVCGLSNLNNDKIDTIKQLEKELGSTILAFSCSDLKAAELSAEQLDRLQAAEDVLGLSLVALSS